MKTTYVLFETMVAYQKEMIIINGIFTIVVLITVIHYTHCSYFKIKKNKISCAVNDDILNAAAYGGLTAIQI